MFFYGVRVSHLCSFLCCVFDGVRVAHLFGGVSVANLFDGVRVTNLFGGVSVTHQKD